MKPKHERNDVAAARGRRRRRPNPHRGTKATKIGVVRAAASCLLLFSIAEAFLPSAGLSVGPRTASPRNRVAKPAVHRNQHTALPDDDLDVAAQIRKAKRLLSDARRKQESRDGEGAEAAMATATATTATATAEGGALPFFASDSSQKIKTRLETGEVVADGETMASLSAREPWENRPLSQMFRREARADYDGNLVEGGDFDGKALADRDLARNMYSLRKSLQNDDFKRVFDSRNRFIGEVE